MKYLSTSLVWLLLGAGDLATAKAPWVREHMHPHPQRQERQRATSQGKRMFNNALTKRQATNETVTESCVINAAQELEAEKDNIWLGLTTEEAVSLVDWMFAQPDLNLTEAENATAWDNTLLIVELMPPNKTDALAYIDRNGTAPARYAHAIINHSADLNPYYQDILVGPLPVRNGTTRWEPLEYTMTRKTEGKVRNLDANDDNLYGLWHYAVAESIADITKDLWNATMLGLDNDTLTVWGIDPLWQDGDDVLRWDAFFSVADSGFDVGSILPMGLYFMSNVSSRNPDDWELLGWYMDGDFWNTTEAFRADYEGGNVRKNGGNVDNDDFHTDPRGPRLPMEANAPPDQVAPHGARFAVDAEQKYVEWMDWSFYISFNRDTGMALHDIRLKGQRVLYELGLQEALAHYAGSDPMQAHVAYLDSYYGFGPFNFELIQGFDCPAYSTYLNTSFYVDETTHTHVNSICLFEADADYPMSRHSSADYVTAVKNIYFSVRSIATIGNYDYLFTYSFFLDGTMSTEVRASGYIQAAHFAQNTDYGFQIHDNLSGSMHDHVLTFKADFDILGENNTVQFMDVVPHSTTYPWSRGRTFNTMHVERSFLESEDDGAINWPSNSKRQLIVVNQDEKNQYGELRGYRVLPMSAAHLTVENSTALQKAGYFATHDLFVTQRKDTEPRCAHPYNSQDTQNPPVDFELFFDGESLNQTDLVLWLNLGMHHVPHTGDLPNTVFTSAHSGLQFTPSNYFESGVQRQSINTVRIDYGSGEPASNVDLFGQQNDTCQLDYTPVEVNLWNYVGDVVVRKFPYSPDDWYYETDPAS